MIAPLSPCSFVSNRSNSNHIHFTCIYCQYWLIIGLMADMNMFITCSERRNFPMDLIHWLPLLQVFKDNKNFLKDPTHCLGRFLGQSIDFLVMYRQHSTVSFCQSMGNTLWYAAVLALTTICSSHPAWQKGVWLNMLFYYWFTPLR